MPGTASITAAWITASLASSDTTARRGGSTLRRWADIGVRIFAGRWRDGEAVDTGLRAVGRVTLRRADDQLHHQRRPLPGRSRAGRAAHAPDAAEYAVRRGGALHSDQYQPPDPSPR